MNRWQRICQALEFAHWSLQQARGPKSSTTKLPVELLQDMPNLGAAGATIKVNHGYARNYLLPRKLAAVRRGKQSGSVEGVVEGGAARAAAKAKGQHVSEDESRRQAAASQKKKLEAIVRKLTTAPLNIRKKVSEDGKLEKPISVDDVVDAVARQFQIEIVPQLVDMDGEVLPIVGEYQLPLKLVLPGGDRAHLNVNVIST